ncbi:Scr1 family TA system antitoxin-like transcriptional regulator [Streptomyces sp. NPDC006365]|uniref:Scr1 family TA system antitoxin-like transcriptional regulator n=1 Tax=Streptomyces sp. NPDC006365 TaxID=3364744 RepID=UPI003686E29C
MLDEAVIRRPVGGHAVMSEQLAHVLRMARTPHVSYRYCPSDRANTRSEDGSLNS